MQLNPQSGYIHRVAAAIRLQSPLIIDGLRQEVATDLETHFPQQTWLADRKVLRLFASNDEYLEITEDRLSYSRTNISREYSIVSIFTQLQQRLNVVIDALKISEFNRCDILTRVLFDVPGPLEAVSFISENFTLIKDSHTRTWGSGLTRAEVAFSFYKDRIGYFVRLMPDFLGETFSEGEIPQIVVQADVETYLFKPNTGDIAVLLEESQVAVRDKLPAFLRDAQRGR